MSEPKFPPGWDEERVRQVLAHYENQTEDEQFAEIEAAREAEEVRLASISQKLFPEIHSLLARKRSIARTTLDSAGSPKETNRADLELSAEEYAREVRGLSNEEFRELLLQTQDDTEDDDARWSEITRGIDEGRPERPLFKGMY